MLILEIFITIFTVLVAFIALGKYRYENGLSEFSKK